MTTNPAWLLKDSSHCLTTAPALDVVLWLLLTLLPVCEAIGQGTPPYAWTNPATDITTNSAVLHGQVDPRGFSTTAWFRWGVASAYEHTTLAADAGSCHCNFFFTALLTGLTPGTTYLFRTAASNLYGAALYPGPWPYDVDWSFTTLSMPPVVTISTGSGYWDAASSTLSYTGEAGSYHNFILLQSAELTAPLTSWARVATNDTLPSTFAIPSVGSSPLRYYCIQVE